MSPARSDWKVDEKSAVGVKVFHAYFWKSRRVVQDRSMGDGEGNAESRGVGGCGKER